MNSIITLLSGIQHWKTRVKRPRHGIFLAFCHQEDKTRIYLLGDKLFFNFFSRVKRRLAPLKMRQNDRFVADHFSMKSSAIVVVQSVRLKNIRFRAKHAPFIRTPNAKKPHSKIQPSSPYFGVKWGELLKNAEKRANIRISRPLSQILKFSFHLCVAPKHIWRRHLPPPQKKYMKGSPCRFRNCIKTTQRLM
jgi:hypothetical protein